MEEKENSRKSWSPYERISLWVGCGGRCTLCGRDLLRSHLTGDPGVYGEFAHIEAHSPKGPRGNGKTPYDKKESIDNIIVLCRVCHPNIDKYPDKYPTEYLQQRKLRWESEVRQKVYMEENSARQVLIFSAPIAGTHIDVSDKEIRKALFDIDLFPGENHFIHIDLQEVDLENEELFWKSSERKLVHQFEKKVVLEDIPEGLAVFGIAPIPLLIKFGTLLSDLPNCNIFNLYRDPNRRWCWNEEANASSQVKYIINKPEENTTSDQPKALVISMTSDISDRIKALNRFKIWEVKSSVYGYESLQTRKDLESFRLTLLNLLDEISKAPGDIHIFMAAPNAAAIMLGMCLKPKLNQNIITYDYISSLKMDKEAIKISCL